MNILFVTDYFSPHIGGVEKLFDLLSNNLVTNGHQVTYITWHYKADLPKKEFRNGVEIIRIPAPTRTLFPFFAIRKIIQKARSADLIHTSTYSSAIGTWFAAKLLHKKTVVTVHEVWMKLWLQLPFMSTSEKHLFMFLERFMLKLPFSHYIAVSDATRLELINAGINTSKISRIYNGITYDLPQWRNPEGKFTFTFFGRGGTSKGLDLLIPAAEKLCATCSDVEFVFILSPQKNKVYHQIINQINSGNLLKNARLYSNLPHNDLIDQLLNSHCVVIPSYCEGFGFTAAEASAMGIPIISSGRGSLPEVVSGKVITMEEFSIDGLFAAMNKVMNNQWDSSPLKRFEIARFIQEHFNLYQQISSKP